MSAFTRTAAGLKRFVIEWDMFANNNDVTGDAFEVAGCNALSISTFMQHVSGAAPTAQLYISNHSDVPYTSSYSDDLEAGFSDYVPKSRWLFPKASAPFGSGQVRVAILFEEL